jgi:hypothetical protein
MPLLYETVHILWILGLSVLPTSVATVWPSKTMIFATEKFEYQMMVSEIESCGWV